MSTKLATFRFTPDDFAQLDELKAKGFPSRTAAVRWAVAHALMGYEEAVADDAHLIELVTKSYGEPGPLATKWKPRPIEPIAPLPQPNGIIKQANRTIKLVSAKGVSPPILGGQSIKVLINDVPVTVTLDNCCRLSRGVGVSHTKGCILRAFGYVD